MKAVKKRKWIIAWKNTFYWPCEWCKVGCRFFSSRPISSWAELRHINTAWLPRTVQNGSLWSHFCRDEFLHDSRHLVVETSMGEKAECLLAIGEDKNISFLEWPSPLMILLSWFLFSRLKKYFFGFSPCSTHLALDLNIASPFFESYISSNSFLANL